MALVKKIEGYPDYYVSSAGNVWKEKSNDFYLKLIPSNRGSINLYYNGNVKNILVYRLVAQTFIPIPSKYEGTPIEELEVHHIDHNRKNNRASNLMWLAKAEHKKLHSESEVTKQRLSAANKGRSRPEGSGKPPKTVIQYTMKGEFIAEYASVMDAERLTNVKHGSICKCCSGKRNSAGGFIWKFA